MDDRGNVESVKGGHTHGEHGCQDQSDVAHFGGNYHAQDASFRRAWAAGDDSVWYEEMRRERLAPRKRADCPALVARRAEPDDLRGKTNTDFPLTKNHKCDAKALSFSVNFNALSPAIRMVGLRWLKSQFFNGAA